MKFAIVLGAAALLAWWLSGYDSRVTGENRAADLTRRLIRCGVTLFLVSVALAGMVFFCIPVAVVLAVYWAGCVSELFARGFHGLIDSVDNRELDGKALTRQLDQLSALVQEERNEEAIQLCARLRDSAQGSALAIEAMLFRVYDRMFADERLRSTSSLANVFALLDQKRYAETEIRLNQLLVREPRNTAAYLVLIRLYARELQNENSAHALIERLAKRGWLPPAFVEYARHCLGGWLKPVTSGIKANEGVESLLVERKTPEVPDPAVEEPESTIADLLAAGRLGTAIELLETRVRHRPDDFEAWLMLAEAHGRYCCNLERARETVRRIEMNGAFNPQQIREAQAKLQEWRERLPNSSVAVR